MISRLMIMRMKSTVNPRSTGRRRVRDFQGRHDKTLFGMEAFSEGRSGEDEDKERPEVCSCACFLLCSLSPLSSEAAMLDETRGVPC